MTNYRLAVVGGGNMGAALVGGLLSSGWDAADLTVVEVVGARRDELTALFPDVAVKMTEVGEATGALQEMLNSLSEFYDEEIETKMDRFVTLVEPVLLITMGVVIAALLLALYMPLFQLTSVVS